MIPKDQIARLIPSVKIISPTARPKEELPWLGGRIGFFYIKRRLGNSVMCEAVCLAVVGRRSLPVFISVFFSSQ